MKAIILALVLFLSSCVYSNQHAKIYATTGILADGATTYVTLKDGCSESNAIYPTQHPETILLTNAVIAGSIYYLGEHLPNWFLFGLGTWRFAAVANNIDQNCYK